MVVRVAWTTWMFYVWPLILLQSDGKEARVTWRLSHLSVVPGLGGQNGWGLDGRVFFIFLALTVSPGSLYTLCARFGGV